MTATASATPGARRGAAPLTPPAPGAPTPTAAGEAQPDPQRPLVRSVRDRVGAIWDKLDMGIYQHVRAEYGTLTRLIEANDPSDATERYYGLDGYARLLALAEVRTHGDPALGTPADTFDAFVRSEQHKALFPEWARRQWQTGSMERRPRYGAPGWAPAWPQRPRGGGGRASSMAESGGGLQEIMSSLDWGQGTIQRPYNDDMRPPLDMTLEPAVPLSEIVASTRTTDQPDYRKRILIQPDPGDLRLLRVAEAAELPAARIIEASTIIRTSKFGRKLEASYEALRRVRLDEFAFWIRRMRIQTETDQVAAALSVAVEGDGSAGSPAEVFDLADLDPAATPGELTFEAWLAFRLQWANPYVLTHVLGQQEAILELLTLDIGSPNIMVTNGAYMPAGLTQQFTPINNRLADGVRYGITEDVPAGVLLGLDGRVAIEHVQESGSDVSETERFITRQTEVMTFSIQEAFAVIDPNAAKVLDIEGVIARANGNGGLLAAGARGALGSGEEAGAGSGARAQQQPAGARA